MNGDDHALDAFEDLGVGRNLRSELALFEFQGGEHGLLFNAKVIGRRS
jgi:hypothetical protein